jgi:response regulator RpfG family c-di-GMP phosphodiesterase
LIVLYVDDSKDDAFWFGRALRKVSAPTEWRHVFGTHEAKCYLRGEGMFSQREAFPFPELVISDAKMTDGTGVELLQWIRSQPEFKSLPFCLFSEVEENIRRQLGNELAATVCLFSKPAHPVDWPPIVKQMLEWHSKSN